MPNRKKTSNQMFTVNTVILTFRDSRKKHKKEKKEKRAAKGTGNEEEERAPKKEQEPEFMSSVKPEDLPEVPKTNQYLMRRLQFLDGKIQYKIRSKTPEGGRTRGPVVQSSGRQRTGHRVKGRGAIRFRPDEEEQVRSGSETPPHWKREERRLITLKDLDQKIKVKLEREEKAKEERKHQELRATNEIETFGYRLPVFPPMPTEAERKAEREAVCLIL